MINFLLILFSLISFGCATPTPQSSKIIKNQSTFNLQRKIISDVPFILQKKNHCGPATLAMNLNWYGKNITADEISYDLYRSDKEGSFKTDMIYSARKNGYIAVKIKNLSDILKEVANNRPVIVFQNLGFDWYPLWHYALVVGYDLQKNEITMHSGENKFKTQELRKFERTWSRGGHWAILLTKPTEISITGSKRGHIRNASSLEQMKQLQNAKDHYLAILKKWPNSTMAYFGLSNIAVKESKIKEAITYLEAIPKIDNTFFFAYFNLALLLKQDSQFIKAKVHAKKALNMVKENQLSTEQLNTLKDIINS